MWIRFVLLSAVMYVTVAAPSNHGNTHKDDNVYEACGGKPAELFFLLDSSSSIWSVDFKKQLQFVNDIIDILDISPATTRVGVSSFSYKYRPNIELDTFDNKDDLKVAVSDIPQYLGGTNTFDALDGVRMRGFDKAVVRPGVVRTAIVLTDGESYSPEKTKDAAMRLKNDGVIVFAVSIGSRTNIDEMTSIASEPTDEFLFEVGNYGLLESIKEKLAIKACKVELKDEPAAAPKCGSTNPADVMFLMDPAEIGSARTEQLYDFIGDVTTEFDMEPNKMQVGVESRNCGSENIRLGEYSTKDELLNGLENTELPGMHRMIKRLRTHAYTTEKGGRIAARHMAVIFVDDALNNSKAVLDEARRTMRYDVELFVVAIGDSVVEDELVRLCSPLVERHIIRVPSYDDLKVSTPTFLKQFCHGL